MRKTFIIALFAAPLLAACTAVGFNIANYPSDFSGATIHRDLAYGNKAYQLSDLYLPKSAQPKALIVFIYGGGWHSGNKDTYGFVADAFLQQGYAVAVTNYVTYPQGKFPAFIEDLAQFSAWLKEAQPRYGLNDAPIFLIGHSAGAYNGAMLLADEQYLKAVGLTPSFYKGFIGLAGPYVFNPTEQRYKDVFGTHENYHFMHVTSYINGNEPPMLLLHGGADSTVSPQNTWELAAKVEATGGSATALYYNDVGHIGIISALTRWWRDSAPTLVDSVKFIEAHR